MPTRKKQGCIGCLVIVAILLVIGIIVESCSDGNSTKDTSQTTAQLSNWQTVDVNEDTIKDALSSKPPVNPVPYNSNFHNNITKIEIMNHAEKEGQKNSFRFLQS
jgi:hypothetical protein